MIDEDQIRNVLQRFFMRREAFTTRANCPDEESLANYLSGVISPQTRESLENHLANCTFCLDDLVAAHQAARDLITERVPQRLLDRAMGLVWSQKSGDGVLDIVVRFVKESIELVSTSGDWISPLTAAAAGVRGKTQAAETTILQVEKDLAGYRVAVEVERLDDESCQIAVHVTGESEKPVSGVRVSLIARGREQASYITQQGQASFERIPRGEYNLALSESGAPIGTVRLTME